MTSLRLYAPLILIVLLGFGLRLNDLGAVPLRGDEAFSVLYWADLPVSVSLTQIAHGEPHTPLVYAVGRLWRHLIGGIDSVFALRCLSVFGNMIGLPAIFALGWRLSRRRRVGLLAALMWALHPFEIWHSQEFRNYGYWAGMSVATLWLGLRLIDRRRQSDWLLYTAAAAFTTLTIYTEPFTTLALACFAVIEWRDDRRSLRRLLLLQAAIGLLLIAGFMLVQVLPGFAGSYPGLVQAFAWSDYVTRFAPALVFGATIPLDPAPVGIALSLIAALAGAAVWRASPRQFRFIALAALLPLLLLGLVSSRYNLFHPRYVLSAAPALMLLLVVGSCETARRLQRILRLPVGWGAPLLLTPWIVIALLTLNAHFNDPAYRRAPAWNELGAFLNSRVQEEDLVIQLSVDPAFGYYYRAPAPEMALPVHSTQPPAEIVATLDELRGSYESVYVVAREQAGWANAGLVEGWMRDNLQEVMRTRAGLPARQFMEWSVEAPVDARSATFGDSIALLGHQLFRDPLPTGELLLWLYWKPLAKTETPLKSFAHVYGETNPGTGSTLWAQDDQFPQRGRLDSTSWEIGKVFRDVYYLPTASLVDGDYQVSVGWYEPTSGQRLPLRDDSDSAALEDFQYAAQGKTSG
ncbi:MAG: glycosyltransferase family 39 protein [Chloroflexota bacterium]|nr:glycosyltransferase family 39 protein [Chloroflexota bacterium]MDE2947041.1 glycosyltransferase family 39 protein [Chloroflexota bacterium]